MIDLTLKSFLRPALVGLKPPFGTVIERTTENRGGLSTAEVDNNMAMPLALMRPVAVAASDTTSAVEYDAKLLLTGSAALTVRLAAAAYEGCQVTVVNGGTATATIGAVGKLNGAVGRTVIVAAATSLRLTFVKGGWHAERQEAATRVDFKKEISAPKVWGAVWN